MGMITAYECDGDGCKKRKGSENHWWVLTDGRMHESTGLLLSRLIEGQTIRAGELTLCGEECVTRKISAFMGGRQWAPARDIEKEDGK